MLSKKKDKPKKEDVPSSKKKAKKKVSAKEKALLAEKKKKIMKERQAKLGKKEGIEKAFARKIAASKRAEQSGGIYGKRSKKNNRK